MDNCDLLTINEECTPRMVDGRTALSGPAAFVLHCVNFEQSAYEALLTDPAGDYPTSYPKSVHYLVSLNGSISQFVESKDTALGIDELHNPTWPLLPPTPNVNAPYIHIGYIGSGTPNQHQVVSVSNLLCCLAADLGISVDEQHVLLPSDLDDRRTCPMDLPSAIIANAVVCLQNGGLQPLPNIVELADTVAELEQCCTDNSAAIATNTLEIADNTAAIAEINTWRETFDISQIVADLAQLSQQVADLTSMIGDIKDTLLEHQSCIDEMCVPPDPACVQYQLQPGQDMTITPNVLVWLNLPTQIADKDPALVLPGPLWSACLKDPCSWEISASVRFALADWCAGKTARLFLVACGQEILLDEFVATGGMATVTLTGNQTLIVPPECNDVHLAVWTDDITTPNKVVSFADIQLCCG